MDSFFIQKLCSRVKSSEKSIFIHIHIHQNAGRKEWRLN